MHLEEYESPNLMLLSTLVLTAFLAFAVVLFIVFYFTGPVPENSGRHILNLLLLSAAFGTCLVVVVFNVLYLLAPQFLEQLYDLSHEDAQQLSFYLFIGLPIDAPRRPLLRIQEGQTLPDGRLVMYMDKVGGPGYFSIAHDSAVVTGKLGKLQRVLGPGFYRAGPFEKVWDVIDLRPQRRSLHIEFMTTDGIPAYCDVEIRFQVAGAS
ncbi:MAG: hypothetical protein JXR84_03540, partial [Anaerolineae bacterium]|nr:hypothetical protein [Anaerolineae bacterium]